MDSMSKPLHAGPRRRGGRHRGARRARRRHRVARRDRGRGGLRRARWATARTGTRRVATLGQGLQHHAHDVQEPRLLRPYLRRDRRRARAAEAHEGRRARDRAHPRRQLPRGAGGRRLRAAAHAGRGALLAASTWSRPRSRTAACASPPSSRRGSNDPAHARADGEDRRRDRSGARRRFPGAARRARVAIARATAGARSSCSRRASATRTRRSRTRSSTTSTSSSRCRCSGEARARRRCSQRLWKLDAESAMATMSLAQALFAPRAVALVGASGDEAKNTARPQRYLRKHGYRREDFPDQSRSAPRFSARRAYKSLADVRRRDRPRLHHGARTSRARSRTAAGGRAGREHLQRRLRRRRARRRGAPAAARRARAGARRAPARAEQHGHDQRLRAASRSP